MNKRDVYRLYRAITSVRKGEYWQSIDSLDRTEDSINLQRFLQVFLELQDDSNTSLEILIFITTLFFTIIQLYQSLSITPSVIWWGIGVFIYIASITILGIVHHKRKTKKRFDLFVIEKSLRGRLRDQRNEIVLSDLKNDLISHMTELRLLEELEIEYEKEQLTGSVSAEDIQAELHNIRSVREDLKKRMLDKQHELDKQKKKFKYEKQD